MTEHSVWTYRSAIRTDADPRKFHSFLYVFFSHDEVNGADIPLFLDQQIHQGILGSRPTVFCDSRNGLTFIFLVALATNPRHTDIFEATPSHLWIPTPVIQTPFQPGCARAPSDPLTAQLFFVARLLGPKVECLVLPTPSNWPHMGTGSPQPQSRETVHPQ